MRTSLVVCLGIRLLAGMKSCTHNFLTFPSAVAEVAKVLTVPMIIEVDASAQRSEARWRGRSVGRLAVVAVVGETRRMTTERTALGFSHN